MNYDDIKECYKLLDSLQECKIIIENLNKEEEISSNNIKIEFGRIIPNHLLDKNSLKGFLLKKMVEKKHEIETRLTELGCDFNSRRTNANYKN